MKHLVGVLAAIFITTSLFAQAGSITVKVEGVTVNKGNVEIGLYNRVDNFPDYDKTYKGATIKANSKGIEHSFKNIPAGVYAIAIWHDKDENTLLNTNFLGIPTEKYGFSLNKYGIMGSPDFKEVSFSLSEGENTILKIKLK